MTGGWCIRKDNKAHTMLQRFGEIAPAREVKFAPCDLKSVEADGTFAGYASLFGAVDLGKDLVMPGAFAESLAARGAHGVKLLFQHDPNEPIGVWLELREDWRGLFARGRLMPEVTRGREVLSLMRAGALDGLSIGFRTVQGRSDPASGVRRLDKIDLWEISVVTFPMLPEARVSTVKRREGRSPPTRGVHHGRTEEARLAHRLRRAARSMRRS
jgi:HK97 family phage prohead protease